MAYSIEEEQELNQLKDWWKENGKLIILALVVGVGGVLGWRYWQTHQANKIAQASSEYNELAQAAQSNGVAAHAQVEEYVKTHDKTSYAVFALLDEARGLAAKQDYAGAVQSLEQALSQSQDDVLSTLAALRLSALQLQLGNFDAALASLNQVKNSAFDGRKFLLAGEIQQAKGDNAAAKTAFENALKSGNQAEQQLAQMKLNNL